MTTETDTRALIDRYIEVDPHQPTAEDFRIADHGMHVWALIGYLRAVDGNVAQMATDYEIPMEVAEAALAYYHRRKGAIDARLAANEDILRGVEEATKDDGDQRYIVRDPRRPTAQDARVAGYGMHVWALIGYLKANGNDIAQMAVDYEIPLEVAEAAVAYYHRHKDAIDARLAANEAHLRGSPW